jgi:hypothetical protein
MAVTTDLPITLRATASGDTQVISTPGPGKQLVIRKGSVHNRATALSPVIGLRGGANPAKWVVRLTANGGTAFFDFGDAGWPLAANLPLNINLGATGDVDVNITDWAIEDF